MTGPSIDVADQVIAETAFQIVKHSFDKVDSKDRRCFRIKNLSVPVISAFLSTWSRETASNQLGTTTVVIAGDSDSTLPAQFRADPKKSITWYRNNNSWGLVYVETKTQSDEQGLQNLFTLRDSNFLDKSFDDGSFDVAGQIIDNAWRLAASTQDQCPTLLQSRLLDVLRLVHPYPIPISVRKFANFVLKACQTRVAVGGTLNSDEIDALVGDCLVELDMFPDIAWRQGTSDVRVSRRLVLNAYRAELSSGPSTDLDAEQYADLSQKTVFKDQHDNDFPGQEQKTWQDRCAGYCRSTSSAQRQDIPYYIFEQLFSKDTKGLKLGERVEQEIHGAGPERLPEFEGLEVRDGLNRRIPEDVQKFLEALPKDRSALALKDLLTVQTRRLVERTAHPAAQPFENPLTKLAEVTSAFRGRAKLEGVSAQIEMRLARDDEDSPLVGLFAFLFGATLRSAIEAAGVEAGGLALKVDPRLVEVADPPELVEQSGTTEDQDEDPGVEIQEVLWRAIPIEIRLVDRNTEDELDAELNLEWSPENSEWLALFWLLCTAKDRPPSRTTLHVPPDVHYREWMKQVAGRTQSLEASAVPCPPLPDDGIVSQIILIRGQLLEKMTSDGLNYVQVEEMLDQWKVQLIEAKQQYVPSGRIDPRIGTILSLDTLSLPDNGMVILPTHPFKLRWIAKYLQKSEELALKALAGDLPLNRQNPDLYLDWIGQLLPNQQPAISSNAERDILFSTGDLGWSEMFAPMAGDGGQSHTAGVDSHALSEIARQIFTYLESHPYKIDGLSILVILPHGDTLPADLVKAIRKGEWREMSIDMHVLASRAKWEAVTNAFEALSSGNRMSEGDALFPPLQLKLHEFRVGTDPETALETLSVDIAVVPQFLGDKIDIQQNTEPAIGRAGTFDPLLDTPTFVSGGTAGGSIAVEMLPRAADPALEAWSTLVVRHHRTTPVAAQQPDNVDLIELRIDFQESSRLFNLLHQKAHWVLTLERHITREQIENLEARPDVLIIRENVGANGLYKLIVSSNSGRKFVVDRLARRLGRLVAESHGASSGPAVTRDLAARIYDETRKLAPRLTLQATGVSRVTEEILGLMIARHVAERYIPANPADGIVTWLPLDEHPEWFPGDRADFCRVVLERRDDKMWVDVLVVEGKLRTAFDDHGIDQVKRTLELLKDILPGQIEDSPPIDAKLWREQLLAAMENVSPEARHTFGPAADEIANDPSSLPASFRTRFREGEFHVASLGGLYSLCRHDIHGEMKYEKTPDNEITIVRTFRNHLLDLATPQNAADARLLPGTAPLTPPSAEAPETAPSPEQATHQSYKQAPPQDADPIEAPNGGAVQENSAQDQQRHGPELVKPAAPKSKLSKSELEKRYQQILDMYGEFGISIQAPSDANDRFVEGPATVLYRVKPGQAVDPKRLYEKTDALKLALELDEEQSIRFSIDKGFVNIDVPKREADRYFVDAPNLWSRWTRPVSSLATPLGEDRFGKVVDINFSSSNSPHLLIGGTTGSGKSEALNTILKGLVTHYTSTELKLLLVDPKGTELQGFAESEHLHGKLGWDEDNAKHLLGEAVRQMQHRYQVFRELGKRSLPEYNEVVPAENRIPWWVLVLDEYADLTSDLDAKKEIEANLKRLAQKARAAGIHVIIATQKPSAEVISTNLRSNLPAQLALKVKSATESRVIMDEAGAESLNGKGDAFLKAAGHLTRIQCAKI